MNGALLFLSLIGALPPLPRRQEPALEAVLPTPTPRPEPRKARKQRFHSTLSRDAQAERKRHNQARKAARRRNRT